MEKLLKNPVTEVRSPEIKSQLLNKKINGAIDAENEGNKKRFPDRMDTQSTLFLYGSLRYYWHSSFDGNYFARERDGTKNNCPDPQVNESQLSYDYFRKRKTRAE
jgi:hypothetical protein